MRKNCSMAPGGHVPRRSSDPSKGLIFDSLPGECGEREFILLQRQGTQMIMPTIMKLKDRWFLPRFWRVKPTNAHLTAPSKSPLSSHVHITLSLYLEVRSRMNFMIVWVDTLMGQIYLLFMTMEGCTLPTSSHTQIKPFDIRLRSTATYYTGITELHLSSYSWQRAVYVINVWYHCLQCNFEINYTHNT